MNFIWFLNRRIHKLIVNTSAPLFFKHLQPRLKITPKIVRLGVPVESFESKYFYKGLPIKYLVALNVLQWLGFAEEDEDKVSELIMTLKRAVLATKRGQYDKAEQFLHLALRLAQQQQNQQGITYCYDLMANLAFDIRELDKAEKLFVSVLQRLLSTGTNQDDLKVIHISLKLARISHLKAQEEKADIGYKWCLKQIEGKKNDDIDGKLLCGVIHDWYAQFLLDIGDVKTSLLHIRQAYEICSETQGPSEETMLLLNDLGTTYWRAGDIKAAEMCLREASAIGKTLEDQTQVGVIEANLGLIYLENGVIKEAEKSCNLAWKLGKRHDNMESIMQAKYCLDQIKLVMVNK